MQCVSVCVCVYVSACVSRRKIQCPTTEVARLLHTIATKMASMLCFSSWQPSGAWLEKPMMGNELDVHVIMGMNCRPSDPWVGEKKDPRFRAALRPCVLDPYLHVRKLLCRACACHRWRPSRRQVVLLVRAAR